jgi:putative ATP-dependent endonuclease of OLD family
VADNTAKMKGRKDAFVKVYRGIKTLEYDPALHAENRTAMLKALKEIHPKIGEGLKVAVNGAPNDVAKARALFCGRFERKQNNVQKGRFERPLRKFWPTPRRARYRSICMTPSSTPAK